MFSNYKLFKNYYPKKLLGGRVCYELLRYTFTDKDEKDKFISTFYVPCPYLKWLKESPSNHYYILKPKWSIVLDLLVLGELLKLDTKHAHIHIWRSMSSIFGTWKSIKKYMDSDAFNPNNL